MGRIRQEKLYLAIDEFENINRDTMKFVVNRADDGFNGALNGVNAWLQRARIILGVTVEFRSAHQGMEGRDLHEFKVLEALVLLALRLHKETNQSQSQKII